MLLLTTCQVFFAVGITTTYKGRLASTITFAISVLIAWCVCHCWSGLAIYVMSRVPEGLPATVTLLLSIAAKRMAKVNVLVKDLRSVETLGALTCLCTDKTGTLTRNQMTVTAVWTSQRMLSKCCGKAETRFI